MVMIEFFNDIPKINHIYLVAAKTTQLAQVNFFQRCSEGNSSFNILLIGMFKYISSGQSTLTSK